jgi:S-adenosylmethionine:tRNA ribosyltransferase-isomerase
MKLSDFDYRLPEELIATQPLARRDSSRLLVLGRRDGSISNRRFSDLKDYLRPGDALVLNDTRVIKARLLGAKETGGKVEVFLVRERESFGALWEALVKPSKGLKPGAAIAFGRAVSGRLAKRLEDGAWLIDFSQNLSQDRRDFLSIIEEIGLTPLPPYIKRPPEKADDARYQTVFAQRPGAVAAPTAGLHFTEKLLSEIEGMGVVVRRITLHTGPGTFLPVRAENIEDHRMHAEHYSIDPVVFSDIMEAKKKGGRVIAVGSTSTRTLETAASAGFDTPKLTGDTALFIYPGYEFKIVDAILTNFHLPKSTLIMLVSAFAGRESVLKAYAEAVAERYRFFSYGDAMLIL